MYMYMYMYNVYRDEILKKLKSLKFVRHGM